MPSVYTSWSLIGTDIAVSLCFGIGMIRAQAKQSRGLAAGYVGSLSPISSPSCDNGGCFCSAKSELRGRTTSGLSFKEAPLSPPLWIIPAHLESQAIKGPLWCFQWLSPFCLPTCAPILTLLTFWSESLSFPHKKDKVNGTWKYMNMQHPFLLQVSCSDTASQSRFESLFNGYGNTVLPN